ncbi:MAG: PfaD family polyunsaturated fatty acid/polyketide biosynthesis protein, partial [bacterium]|nr:PfaD family polyunsaturated fatty acid/polyketide biosynthesis protein [bacterium]
LKVSGAFHSPLMEESRQQFENYLKQFEFKNQSIPIISNVTARPHKQEHIRENMIRQITAPVRWAESIRYLLALGIEINDFTELGVKGVSVVKALAIRTNNEAGPLDAAILEAEKAAEAEEAKSVAKTQTVAEVKTVPTPGESSPGTPAKGTGAISVDALGSSEFRKRYNLKYAYLSGGMYKGISSESLVVRMAKAGLLGFFGCSGLKLNRVEEAIRSIRSQLPGGQAFGMNLVSTPMAPEMEANTIDLFLRNGITIIEAAAFMQITPALVRYRAMGLSVGSKGNITAANKLIAKVSRPEVARHFMSPAPEYLLEKLLNSGKISQSQADLLRQVPMADDLCVEADSGGHTDQGMPYALMPSIIKLRDELQESHAYKEKIHVGAAGGIGTPAAAAAAFILGADFVLTGSVNQCTVEAGISNTVKDMLQDIDVQDTEYAPAGDMFEMGAKVQVLKKGVFFPARANKLYDLYRNHNSLDDLNEKTKKQLQERYFKRSFHNVYQDVINFFPPKEIKKAEKNPKHKMALVFRWYFGHSTRLAFKGNISDKVDFQVHCGPALGAFNRWVKDSKLESWKNRHVDDIAKKLMTGTAALLEKRLRALTGMT